MYVNFEVTRNEFKDALQKAFNTNNFDIIEHKVATFTRSRPEVEVKSPLDQPFRDVLLVLIENESDVSVLERFIEFCIKACRKSLCAVTMPVILLGEIFEVITVDMSEKMFNFVENNVQVWKEELFFAACKNNLLRLCNDLLRRLSRSIATVFCGRILLFLSKFLPFSERSGLNIVSEFNLENVTEYGRDASEDIITEITTEDKKNIVIDFTLYCKFWQLQDYFRNPNQCYTKVAWKQFCAHATNILNTFQGIKIDYVSSSDQNNTEYFAKYLTSQKLFDLQLYDVNFRRSVLLQFLTVFQYLMSAVKFKSDSYELKSDQKEWIQSNTEKVYGLLRDTPPDGAEFAEIVRNILSREELWNAWKNDGCPEIKRTPSDGERRRTSEPDRPLLGDIIKEASSQGKFYMGSPELTKLWNHCPDNLEACKGRERDFLPSLEEYFAEIIDQIEANQSSEGPSEIATLKDSNFGWRALRLLARRSTHFFTYSSTILNPLSAYLEIMVQKIAHERPGRVLESSQDSQNDNELEEADNLLTEEEQTGQNLEENFDDSVTRSDKNISPMQLQMFGEKLALDWQKLALKLGYKNDEIDWFKKEYSSEVEQAAVMLQNWFDDDEDATLENFQYILEGLELNEAAEAVRNEINSSTDSQ